MSSRAVVSLVASTLLIGAAAGTAQAAARCPTSVQGHPLRAMDGGFLYDGPIEKNILLAPDSTQQGPGGWVNRWTFRDQPVTLTLVCRYENLQVVEQIKLTPEVRTCRQDARSFVCQ